MTHAREASVSCCAICGEADRRMLDQVRLSGGEVVTMCGSHELAVRRLGQCPPTLALLKRAIGERRRASERRFEGDELSEQLTAAFSRDRRASERRVASGRR